MTKRSVTVAIMVAGSSVVSMKIKRGNEAVLLFFIIYTSCYVTVVMVRKYKVWRESRIGSQYSKSLGFGGECGKVVE